MIVFTMLHSVLHVIFWICIFYTLMFIWRRVRRRIQWWVAFRKIPGPSYFQQIRIVWPFIFKSGIIDLAAAFQTFISPHVKKCPLIALGVGPISFVLLCKAEAAKVLLSNKTQLEKATLYAKGNAIVGDGVGTSKGAKWHQRRKLLKSTFNMDMLDNYLVVMNEQAAILVRLLEEESNRANGVAFDMCPYISRCTLDIVCETALNEKLNCQLETDRGYCKAIKSLVELLPRRFIVPWLRFDWIYRLTEVGKKELGLIEKANALPNEVIKNKLRQFAESKDANNPTPQVYEEDEFGNRRRMALLDMLVEMSGDDSLCGSQKLTEEDIRDEVKTFMFAGFEASFNSISWALYHIGRNSDVQQKIVDELNLVYGDDDRHSSSDDLNNLKYLECVIKEALRLNPPAPVIGRYIKKEMDICGCTIPAETDVFITMYWVHRDPAHFPDPDTFNPDRFLPENSQGRDPFAYIPFAAGLRNCIGQKFAMMEVKVILAAILRKFHVTVLEQDDISSSVVVFIASPLRGIWVQLDSR